MSTITDEQSPLFLSTNANYILAQIDKEEDGNLHDEEEKSLT